MYVSETLSESSSRIDMCECASSFAHLGRENSGVETDESIGDWSVTETRLISFWDRFVFGLLLAPSAPLLFYFSFYALNQLFASPVYFDVFIAAIFFIVARLAGVATADRAIAASI